MARRHKRTAAARPAVPRAGIVSPALQRLHHAVDAQGCGAVNFGFVLVCWDQLTGRATTPVRGVAPPMALAGRPVPVEQADERPSGPLVITRQFVRPFRLRRRGDGR